MRRSGFVALVAALCCAAGCAGPVSPAPVGSPVPGGSAGSGSGSAGVWSSTATVTPGVTASPSPAPPDLTAVQVWQLRYALLDHYPDFAYCDPDFYPVARGDEQAGADDWWSHADRGGAEVRAILAHHGYRAPLTPAQRLAAYRDHKKLTVIVMTAVAGGYQYTLSTSAAGGQPDQTVVGLIAFDATISERSRSPRPGGCPICLEAGALIATPHGQLPVADIKPGAIVWTLDADGRRIAAPVRQVTARPTPGPHLMVRLALSDGRVLIAAGAHPTAEGTYLRALRTGAFYDGATISSIGWVLSTAPATFDLLPAGATGDYWANGILLGSTLEP